MCVSGDEDEGDDEAVECECLAENEDEYESHEEPFLEGVATDAHVAHLANCVSCRLSHPPLTTQLKPQTRPDAMCAKPCFWE